MLMDIDVPIDTLEEIAHPPSVRKVWHPSCITRVVSREHLESSREGDMKVETDVKAGGAIWGDGRGNHNETIVG